MIVDDKEQLISRAIRWYQANGDAMIPHEPDYADFFHSTENEFSHTHLYALEAEDSSYGVFDVRRRLVPFLVAIGLEKTAEQLGKIIIHHKIEPDDLAEIMWSLLDTATLKGTYKSFFNSDMHINFYRALNTDQSLLPLAWEAIDDGHLPHEAAAGMLFLNDPNVWLHNRVMVAAPDAVSEIIENSAAIPVAVDLSLAKNWPDGDLNTLLERSGAYLERSLLNHTVDLKREEPSFWYNFLCYAPSLKDDTGDQVEHYRRIFQAVDPNEPRFLRGMRSIFASYDGSNHLIHTLSRMLEAADSFPHIKAALDNELMLMRVTWDPQSFNLFDMDLSRVHPRLIHLFSHDQQGFMPRLCQQLIDLPITEFNKSDLGALQTAILLFPDQPVPSIDVEKLLAHLMAAFAHHKSGYADWLPLHKAQRDIIQWIAHSHDFTPQFLDSLQDKDLEVMALAGVQTHRRLSTQALGRVFDHDLGL